MLQKIFIALLILLPNLVLAQKLTGVVTKIKDGDSFYAQFGRYKNEIRINGIDAPETKQQYGKTATKQLKKLLKIGDTVTVTVVDVTYGRLSCRVLKNDKTDVGLEMVKRGAAWWSAKYNQSMSLRKAEDYARKKRLGLWHYKKPLPPWTWRAKHNYKDW